MDESIAQQTSCSLKEARFKRMAASDALTVERKPIPVAANIPNESHDRRGSGTAHGLSEDVTKMPRASAGPAEANLSESLEMITDEVSMCLRYYAAQFPGKRVDRLVFVGGEARHKGLCQEIARRLKLSAQMADPMARIGRTGNEPRRAWT
jgi:Tfp pilus assembly PilM family ATPase